MTDKTPTTETEMEPWQQEGMLKLQGFLSGLVKTAGPLIKKYRDDLVENYEGSDLSKQGIDKEEYIKVIDRMIAESELSNNPH